MELPRQYELSDQHGGNPAQLEQSPTQTQLDELNRRVTTYIKANPGKCLLGAIAAGYIVGYISRRR